MRKRGYDRRASFNLDDVLRALRTYACRLSIRCLAVNLIRRNDRMPSSRRSRSWNRWRGIWELGCKRRILPS